MNEMQDCVLVSQCGGFHARPGVEASQAAGLLQRYVATHPMGARLPQEKLLDLNRLFFPMLCFGYAARRTGIGLFNKAGDWYDRAYKDVFNRLVTRQITDRTRILHAYSCGQERCWDRCEKLGVKKLIEHGTAYPRYDLQLLAAESERLGISDHPYKDLAPIVRMEEEFARMDRIYVVSDYVRRTFEESGYKSEKLVVNRLCIDPEVYRCNPDRWSKETLAARKFTVITGGFLCVRKGTHYLLEAVAKLKRGGCDFYLGLLGSPYFFGNQMEQYAGVADHVGSVSFAPLLDWYNRADVLVLPSLTEGMSRVVMEAMACGTPCITTDTNGASEVITDGEDGFVIPAFSEEAIREKIELLYRDRERAVAMGQRALEKARKNNWDSYCQTLLADYRRLLG